MAYTFQKIKDAFGNESEQKVDIFAPQQSGAGEAPPAGGTGGSEVKTSTEGTITGAPGTSASTQSVTPQQAQAPKAQIIKANLGKVQAPKAFGQIESALGSKTQELQNEANQYLEGAKTQDYNVNQDVVKQATKGDENASSQIASRLSQRAPSLEGFKPKTDTNIEGLSAIKSAEGALGLIAKEAGPQYTAGEKALTRSILERSPEFSQIREALARKADDYEKNLRSLSSQKTQEAQDIANKNFSAGTDRLKGYLEDERTALNQDIARRLAAENERRAQARGRGLDRTYTTDQALGVLGDLRNAYQKDPELLKYINEANIVPDSFYSVSAPELTREQAIDPETAQRFQRINALMGLYGGPQQNVMADTSGAFGADVRQFNRDAYRDAILSKARNELAQSRLPRSPQQPQGVAEFGMDPNINAPLPTPVMQGQVNVPNEPVGGEVPFNWGNLQPSGNAPAPQATPGTAYIPGAEGLDNYSANGQFGEFGGAVSQEALRQSAIAAAMGIPFGMNPNTVRG